MRSIHCVQLLFLSGGSYCITIISNLNVNFKIVINVDPQLVATSL